MQMKIDTPYSAWRLWWGFVRSRPLFYTLGGISVVITNSMQVFIPQMVGQFVDFLKSGTAPAWLKGESVDQTFLHLFLALIGGVTLIMIVRFGWRFFLARNTHLAGAFLREKIWQHARLLPKNKLEREYSTGVLMNASTSDVNTARMVYGFTLVATFDVIFLGIFTTVAMLSISREITFWTYIVFPFLPYFIRKLSAKEGELYEKSQEFLSQFNDQAAQAVATIRLQRLTQTGKFWERKLGEAARKYREKRLFAIFTSLKYFPLMGSGTILSYAILFVVGIKNVLAGSITVGQFVTLQSYVILMQDPLLELGFIISECQRSTTSLKRLAQIYNEPAALGLTEAGIPLVQQDLVYDLKHVGFSYPEMGRQILSDFSLQIKRKERIGLTGPIGSGKTTLLNILSGLERNHSGEVKFLGEEMSSYAHRDLRSEILIVPQKTFLFAETIRNNISLDKNLSDEEIWHYLELASLAQDVRRFPQGIDTPLGEWGINLSGGQKQRLTLARALAQRPRVLLLDDCLSAVDTVTEEKILRSLDRELKEVTLVWVAHRQSTLKYCDRVLHFSV